MQTLSSTAQFSFPVTASLLSRVAALRTGIDSVALALTSVLNATMVSGLIGGAAAVLLFIR